MTSKKLNNVGITFFPLWVKNKLNLKMSSWNCQDPLGFTLIFLPKNLKKDNTPRGLAIYTNGKKKAKLIT
jgi:hypothetical protein